MGETEIIEKESVKRRPLVWNREDDSEEDVSEGVHGLCTSSSVGFFKKLFHTAGPGPSLEAESSFHSNMGAFLSGI